MELPTLYKLNSSKKLMQWSIGVKGAMITTTYGQVDGKLQTTSDLLKKGKNDGQSNATTAEQQAEAEAKAAWSKQQRIKGYSQDMAEALQGSSSLRGEFDPMLAKSFDDDKRKIAWPAILQPKLDGIRCGGLVWEGEVELQTRNGKPITAVPHVAAQILQAFHLDSGTVLDGELYNHELKSDFEKLVSIVRKANAVDAEQQLQYHVYDLVDPSRTLSERLAILSCTLCNEDGTPKYSHLRFVESSLVLTEQEALDKTRFFMDQGYEGGMVRNLGTHYEPGKRSFNLQKIKTFLDGEFRIVGITEGRGKLAGHAATFLCVTEDGKQFGAKLDGETSRLKLLFEDHSLWQGKRATIVYQNLTKEGIPRFPIAKSVRDYE